jgi:hypothetical protein
MMVKCRSFLGLWRDRTRTKWPLELTETKQSAPDVSDCGHLQVGLSTHNDGISDGTNKQCTT